jgi:hypothetical protein
VAAPVLLLVVAVLIVDGLLVDEFHLVDMLPVADTGIMKELLVPPTARIGHRSTRQQPALQAASHA